MIGLFSWGRSDRIRTSGIYVPNIAHYQQRHTVATMALENGMDVKTLSATIGQVSAATTLDIYSHMTDTMQMQAAVNIDRKIGGTDAQMPEVKQTPAASTNTPVNATYEPSEPHPEPIPRKIRKSGTGCVYQINDHLWEGSFYPRLPNGKRKSSTSTPKPVNSAKSNSPK